MDKEITVTKQLSPIKSALKEIRFFLEVFKVIFVSLIVWNAWMTYNMILWFQSNHKDLSEAAAAGFIGIILALLANIKWAMEKSVETK